MGDMGEVFRDMKAKRQLTRHRYGLVCEKCQELYPRGNATVLLPGQKCFRGHRDPRPKLTEAEHKAIWAELGYTMESRND